MSLRGKIAAVWSVALLLSAGLVAWAIHPASAHRAPSLDSGPLFAVPSGHVVEPVRGPVAQVAVTLSDKGCDVSQTTLPVGPVTFTVSNPGHTVVSEAELYTIGQILGEAEGVDAGSTRSFSIRLAEGSYSLVCPGTGAPGTTISVVPTRG